jgi:hypothetical protein
MIARSMLLQKNYPIHWYVDFLKYSSDCLRELSFDVIKTINSAKLPVNSYKAITLPCDYVDWVKVGYATGQWDHPLAQGAINRLNNFDSNGVKIPYEDTMPDGSFAELRGTVAYTASITALGEHVGGVYNHNPGRSIGTFREIRERNEIQLDNDFPYEYIILDYISDGSTCSCGCGCESDNATQVHPYAMATIEAYADWKHKHFNRYYNQGDVYYAEQNFIKQCRILRARMDPLTRWDVVHAARQGYSGTYKN